MIEEFRIAKTLKFATSSSLQRESTASTAAFFAEDKVSTVVGKELFPADTKSMKINGIRLELFAATGVIRCVAYSKLVADNQNFLPFHRVQTILGLLSK